MGIELPIYYLSYGSFTSYFSKKEHRVKIQNTDYKIWNIKRKIISIYLSCRYSVVVFYFVCRSQKKSAKFSLQALIWNSVTTSWVVCFSAHSHNSVMAIWPPLLQRVCASIMTSGNSVHCCPYRTKLVKFRWFFFSHQAGKTFLSPCCDCRTSDDAWR